MNDKCSAGTGRFLEVMANNLATTPEELCELASSGSGVHISSMCTVFAESEVVGLVGSGESTANIAYAILDSIVTKVASQASRLLPANGCVCLTGGLCNLPHFSDHLQRVTGHTILCKPEGHFAGAIGAALIASDLSR